MQVVLVPAWEGTPRPQNMVSIKRGFAVAHSFVFNLVAIPEMIKLNPQSTLDCERASDWCLF